MPLNDEQLKTLGAQILAADNDKFGLKTDGKGNVIIPAGSSFMEQVLKLDKKYFALADGTHKTPEQPFTEKNAAAMKAAGVERVFLEQNEKERAFVEKLARESYERVVETDEQLARAIETFGNLDTQFIKIVASDPREKFALAKEISSEKRDANLLVKGYEILSKFNAQDLLKKGQAHINAVKAFTSKLTPDEKESLYQAFAVLQDTIRKKTVDINAGVDIYSKSVSDDIVHLADILDARTKITSSTGTNLVSIKNEIYEALDSVQDKIISLQDEVISEAKRINPDVFKKIIDESFSDKKVILNWGSGHFSDTFDLNEMLKLDQDTLVILCVYDKSELEESQAIIRDKKMADSPDYIYMPERKGDDGKLIPEKVISVAEYLAAQKALEKNAQPSQEKPTTQKATGRG